MRTWLLGATVALTLASASAGCAFKASEEECRTACENVAKVSQTHIDQKIEATRDLAESGEEGKAIARDMATAMIDAVEDECLKQCMDKGTRDKAECLSNAKSVEDLEKCK
ncbi:MAG: hypothetical protein ACQEXJ_07020 [Myxococcota bacterium]